MNGINKFIINQKLKDLVAFCDDSDKVLLNSLIDKYKISYSEITDGTRKFCDCCKIVKPLSQFKTHNKGGLKTHTGKCYDCYNRECAKRSLFKTGMKQLMEPYDEKIEQLKDCNGCVLSITETYVLDNIFSNKSEVLHYQCPNKTNKECVKCDKNKDAVFKVREDANEVLTESLNQSITNDHIELKVILNQAVRKIADYKKQFKK